MRGLCFFLLGCMLYAQSPEAFKRLGSEYERDLNVITQLQQHPYFSVYRENMEDYGTRIGEAFAVGYRLDAAIAARAEDTAVLDKAYLKALRGLEKERRELGRFYVQALNYAMKNDDMALFELLLKQSLEPIENHRIRKRLQSYYIKRRAIKKIGVAEALLADMALEERSRREAMQEREAYEEHLRVVAEEEAARLRSMTAEKRTRNVIVSTKKSETGYEFFAENLNAYAVTVTLTFKEIDNFVLSRDMPLYIELAANSRQKVVELLHEDRRRKASFSSSFGWVMGLASARHDENVLYRLPFSRGSRVYVSQGYDGASTHKGLSRYAVDFSVPVGTPVYAARGGKVVATESRHDKGGFSKEFGKYANYVVIEHSDATLGKYYHLKHSGVAVSVGDTVEAGELVGYSGNTGYSSGPHLHFSVSKVDPDSMNRPLTLPVRFATKEGVVSRPKRNDSYAVGAL